MTRILRNVAEAFPPVRQETILNNHRVIGIATNASMMLNCALVTYLVMTAEVGLLDRSGFAPEFQAALRHDKSDRCVRCLTMSE